jgi:hypothetical protein
MPVKINRFDADSSATGSNTMVGKLATLAQSVKGSLRDTVPLGGFLDRHGCVCGLRCITHRLQGSQNTRQDGHRVTRRTVADVLVLVVLVQHTGFGGPICCFPDDVCALLK